MEALFLVSLLAAVAACLVVWRLRRRLTPLATGGAMAGVIGVALAFGLRSLSGLERLESASVESDFPSALTERGRVGRRPSQSATLPSSRNGWTAKARPLVFKPPRHPSRAPATSVSGDIVVTGMRIPPYMAKHTATIEGGFDLPRGVVRVGRPAILTYQLKPPGEVAEGEFSGDPQPTLLESLRSGAYVDVSFGCNACDETDNQQASQRLIIDHAALSHGVMRSVPVRFAFTPRTAPANLAGPNPGPHASLVFRVNGVSLDTWVVPVKTIAEGEPAPTEVVAPLEHTFERAPFGRPPVRLQYHRVGQGPYTIDIQATKEYLPWLRPLASAGARMSSGRDFYTLSIEAPKSGSNSLPMAAGTLVGQLESIVRAISADTPTAPCVDAPNDALAGAPLAKAIKGCLYPEASGLRTVAFPQPVQQFLFDLARCDPARRSEEDWSRQDEGLPLRVVGGVPYLPLQFTPMDSIGGRTATCSKGLAPAPEGDLTGLSGDLDYLGLALPLVIELDTGLSGARNTATAPEDKRLDDEGAPPEPKILVAGIYRDEDRTEDPTPGTPEFLFDQMATELDKTDDYEVTRDAQTFLKALIDQHRDVELIVINAHGRRRGVGEDTAITPPDNLIFSHWTELAGNPSARVPRSARTNGMEITTAFGALQPGDDRFFRRPAVLLLACETAAYREAYSIPFAFINNGAGMVVSTDVLVGSALARDFGQTFLSFVRDDNAPETAVFLTRRKLVREQATPLGLIWNVVGPPNAR